MEYMPEALAYAHDQRRRFQAPSALRYWKTETLVLAAGVGALAFAHGLQMWQRAALAAAAGAAAVLLLVAVAAYVATRQQRLATRAFERLVMREVRQRDLFVPRRAGPYVYLMFVSSRGITGLQRFLAADWPEVEAGRLTTWQVSCDSYLSVRNSVWVHRKHPDALGLPDEPVALDDIRGMERELAMPAP